MKDQALPIIDSKKCTVCGLCVYNCPETALAVQDTSLVFVNSEACTYCGTCEDTCPEGAVRLEYVIRWA